MARQQFYRQNNLPAELNLIIEQMVSNDLFLRDVQKDNYKRVVEYFKEKTNYLNEIANLENEIKEGEQQEREKEAQELLKKEIKEHKEKWENYLNTKPLPALPKKQGKIKLLGNKLKAEVKQIVKPLPKPVIRNNIFWPFLV